MQLKAMTTRHILFVSLLALPVCADSITLTQFQEIAGFPSACTAVYETPIQGCTTSDFKNGGPCSQDCVSGLKDLTSQLHSACAGIATSSNTLIGLFMRDKGISTICPKIAPSAVATTTTTTQAAAASSAVPSSISSQDSTSTSITQALSSTLSTTSTTIASTQTTSSASSVQTSFSIVMTSSLAPVATPAGSGFGGDIGNLNGPSNGASDSKLYILPISLLVAGLTIGILV